MNDETYHKAQRGFIALIAVIVLASTALSFSLATLGSAASYADAVDRRELRIQARLNAESCLDTAALMSAKDALLVGDVSISELGCVASVSRDPSGNVSIRVHAALEGVSSGVVEGTYVMRAL